jgi:peptidoglycan/xylan/chitin deacetylase (PgdA/CDA1 family)
VTERTDRSPDDPSGLHVRLDRFRSQLDYLEHHHRVLSLRDYLKARREGKPLPDYSVVLTFDDGYRNFFTVVAPCLIERGLPASVFLITDRIVDGGRDARNACWTPDDDRAFLSWGEVSELEKRTGIWIGSHTCSHARLSSLSGGEVVRELKDSRAALATHVSEEALALAYPYGDYTDPVVGQARGAGYVCALTTDEGPNELNSDLFTLRRTLIGDDDAVPAFAARVSGLTCWLGGARAILGNLRPPRPRGSKDLSRARPEQTRS